MRSTCNKAYEQQGPGPPLKAPARAYNVSEQSSDDSSVAQALHGQDAEEAPDSDIVPSELCHSGFGRRVQKRDAFFCTRAPTLRTFRHSRIFHIPEFSRFSKPLQFSLNVHVFNVFCIF